jgi:hypothetical protein
MREKASTPSATATAKKTPMAVSLERSVRSRT